MTLLSIVIPTRNRSGLLANALNSLLCQTLNPSGFEVLVIDNGSTDRTRQVVDEIQPRIANLRYIYEPSPGLHVGRHVGYREARGDILVYADDDIEALPTWLEAIQSAFSDPAAVLVGGKCLPKFETDPPDWLSAMWRPNPSGERILGALSLIDLGDTIKPVNPFYVFGCNFAVRRSLLREAGGFHPDGMPQTLIHFRGDGESYISSYIRSKNYKALYNPDASIYHAVPNSRMTLDYFCRRSFNQGISNSFTAIRREQGLDVESYTIQANHRPPSFYRRLLAKSPAEIPGVVWRRLQRVFRSSKPVPAISPPVIDPYATFHEAFCAAHDQGYAYHRACVAQSPELFAWVTRAEYWDCPLPEVKVLCDQVSLHIPESTT